MKMEEMAITMKELPKALGRVLNAGLVPMVSGQPGV